LESNRPAAADGEEILEERCNEDRQRGETTLVKARNRFRLNRLWLAALAVVLGIVAGFYVGRVSILYLVKSRVSDYSDRVMQREEEIGAEVSTTLAQANASEFPPCSDPDLALLRRLTFGARFLKDVARLGDGKYLCSAASGKLPEELPLLPPDVVLPSGNTIYRNLALKVVGGDSASVITSNRSDVVLSADMFDEFPNEPIHYFVGVPDRKFLTWWRSEHSKSTAPQQVELTGREGTETMPLSVVESPNALRHADGIYRVRCSVNYPVCTVTSITMADAWRGNRTLMAGYLATGGAAGLSCASVLLMAGRRRRSHTNQLKRAILMDKLSVVYQPIVELGGHRIVGAEALARWTDEAGDSIRPETIIALAEAEGFVSEITRFVLTRALGEILPILETQPDFRLSINLAPSDLADPRLLLLLDERLRDSRVTAANVAFELPERATTDRAVAVASIRRLRDRGHAVFIDDFGTGYSNLAYLTELNVDGIKINRSFIATTGTDSVTASIIPQILAVARALSLKVVVQGVEREEQARYFASDDPRILGQGWFFGLPVPARALMYLCAEKSE
jgi:sensor c-di-GMP phosphodiesterase-like protein